MYKLRELFSLTPLTAPSQSLLPDLLPGQSLRAHSGPLLPLTKRTPMVTPPASCPYVPLRTSAFVPGLSPELHACPVDICDSVYQTEAPSASPRVVHSPPSVCSTGMSPFRVQTKTPWGSLWVPVFLSQASRHQSGNPVGLASKCFHERTVSFHRHRGHRGLSQHELPPGCPHGRS